MDGKMIITVIAAWVSYMAINKWIWTPMKRRPNPMRKEDDDPPSPPRLEYDVFLSFRGRDTRKGIANLLYKELESSGIKTFMDEEGLKVGAEISSNLLKAIKESRSAIVLLSPNYATSPWCLNELASIIQGFETRNTTVIPIFYNVEACDVRHQMGSFKEAFIRHEQRKEEKVEHWKAALTTVANLSGLELKNYRSERQLVEDIVQRVYSIVRDLEIESPEDFVEYEATRKAMGKIMNALKDDRFTAIGIYGTGGIGKTTMARHVAAEAKRKGIFDHVAMAVVTHKPVLKDIQGQLAVQLGVKLDEKETIHEGTSKLSQVIMRKNKILIILDDIWKKTDLSLIGIPSYKMLEDRSSKVLLTTRNSKVCSSMDSHPIALDMLNHEDSWNLFVKKTRMSSEKLAVVNEEASILVKECAGLPIALVAIARALRDEDITEWKQAAERLKSSQRRNIDTVVLNCIKLSYDRLTSEDAKLCFLLCCLFPEDYDIQIEELMMYAFGKGLFREGNTLQEARIDCHSAVRSLKSSSLLLGSKHDGHVRMHDVIRNVARKISSSEDGQSVFHGAGRQFQTWPKIERDYCAISLMMNKIRKLPKNLVCSELKVLLLQHNPNVSTIPESFLGCLRELSVLNLSKTSISVLPLSFSLLTNLHSLHLDSCVKISDISVLGKLEKLEILSLIECCPEEVPEAIGNLSRLRMLDISESPVVKIASQVISRLSGLEELYMQCDFVDWRNEVEEAGKETNIGFDELTGSSYLRILKVGIPNAMVLPKNVEDHPDWLYFDICISSDSEVRESTWKPHSSHDYSRTLTLSTPIHNLPKWFTDVVTEKAEKLHYRKCKGLYNILVEYDCGRLNELRYLSIIGPNENLKELMNADARDSNNAAFPKLEELHLFKVENINNLCVGNLPPGSLCKLKLLDVRKCHNLVNALLQSPLLERLQFLEKLLCAHLNRLEYVFGPGKTTACEKLKEMRLCRLPELIKIWSGQAPHAIFRNLKILAVSGCKKLKSLFTSDIAHCLLQLEDLWVHSCFSLDRIVELSEETGKRNDLFPKLQNLVLEDLPLLRRLYSNSSGGPTSLEIEFLSLEYFYKLECPRFSPPNFHSNKQVQVNDIQHYSALKERLWENMELEFTISEDERRRWKYDVLTLAVSHLNYTIDCSGVGFLPSSMTQVFEEGTRFLSLS
uniref:probable disease resistance protein At4g27220 n=1 Tax=Fragaria vesca subsp. vesca TaxID=101020 RepID=UPI0005C87E49|nr:PREDICTED: probable disease resistance protein At4g27220 [Fragaria vesca subsp. vesca]